MNVTLYDFHAISSNHRLGDHCSVYAIIREPSSAADVTVCGGDKRVKSVYVSEAEVIYVQIIGVVSSAHRHETKPARFLLKYEG